MRSFLLTVLTTLALVAPAALAQDSGGVVVVSNPDDTVASDFYGSATVGFASIDGASSATLTAHFGLKDLFAPGFDLRPGLMFYTRSSSFQIGADAIYNFAITDAPLDLYAGVGPQLIIGEDDTAFGLGLRLGTGYPLNNLLSLVGELRFDTFFGDNNFSQFGLGIGARYEF